MSAFQFTFTAHVISYLVDHFGFSIVVAASVLRQHSLQVFQDGSYCRGLVIITGYRIECTLWGSFL